MTDQHKIDSPESRLHFVEFMQMCADSGYISEPTARKICQFAKYQGGVEAIPAFPGDNPEDDDRFTDLLASIPPGERSFENYVVTDDNSYAIELARTVSLIPRIWKSISPILFHAGTGQGKTHLLSAIASTSRQNTLFLNLNDLKMGYRYCVKTNKESQLLSWITSHNFLLLDDLQFVQGDIEFQHFLCSVFNRMPHGKSAIVLCSNSEVENMQDFDSTFFSRISSGISVELREIDLPGRITILERMFSSTGFGPGPEIIKYMATEVSQNIRTLKAAGRAVLANLLASPSKGGISLETVAGILNSMNLLNPVGFGKTQVPISSKETDTPASELNSDKKIETNQETLSPYIVVDIDHEDKFEEERPKIIKKPISSKKVKVPVAPEELSVSEDLEQLQSEDIEDELIFKQAIEEKRAHHKTDEITEEIIEEAPVKSKKTATLEQSRHQIESATTVNSQIDALKTAALRRIEQLEKKNPDSPEIAKLRFAIVFLNEGKIESAMLALK